MAVAKGRAIFPRRLLTSQATGCCALVVSKFWYDVSYIYWGGYLFLFVLFGVWPLRADGLLLNFCVLSLGVFYLWCYFSVFRATFWAHTMGRIASGFLTRWATLLREAGVDGLMRRWRLDARDDVRDGLVQLCQRDLDFFRYLLVGIFVLEILNLHG